MYRFSTRTAIALTPVLTIHCAVAPVILALYFILIAHSNYETLCAVEPRQ